MKKFLGVMGIGGVLGLAVLLGVPAQGHSQEPEPEPEAQYRLDARVTLEVGTTTLLGIGGGTLAQVTAQAQNAADKGVCRNFLVGTAVSVECYPASRVLRVYAVPEPPIEELP